MEFLKCGVWFLTPSHEITLFSTLHLYWSSFGEHETRLDWVIGINKAVIHLNVSAISDLWPDDGLCVWVSMWHDTHTSDFWLSKITRIIQQFVSIKVSVTHTRACTRSYRSTSRDLQSVSEKCSCLHAGSENGLMSLKMRQVVCRGPIFWRFKSFFKKPNDPFVRISYRGDPQTCRSDGVVQNQDKTHCCLGSIAVVTNCKQTRGVSMMSLRGTSPRLMCLFNFPLSSPGNISIYLFNCIIMGRLLLYWYFTTDVFLCVFKQ